MVSLPIVLSLVVLSGGTGRTEMLDFGGDRCIHCRAMDPAVRDLEGMGYPVRRVNIDQEPALRAQFGVTNIPCFVMLVDGREVDRVVGETTFGRLQRMCSKGLAASRLQAAGGQGRRGDCRAGLCTAAQGAGGQRRHPAGPERASCGWKTPTAAPADREPSSTPARAKP